MRSVKPSDAPHLHLLKRELQLVKPLGCDREIVKYEVALRDVVDCLVLWTGCDGQLGFVNGVY